MPRLGLKRQREEIVLQEHKESCRPGDSWGCPERAVGTEGGNRVQSRVNLLGDKHADFTFCERAEHGGKPGSTESG